jgi:hypothetical protein
MTWTGGNCSKCKQRICVTFSVEPADAWKNVVLNRWRLLYPACFDIEAERAGVSYEFAGLSSVTWSQTATWRQQEAAALNHIAAVQHILLRTNTNCLQTVVFSD